MKKKIPVFETSAKTGVKLNEVFQKLIDLILKDRTDEEIIKLELQTGNPICYELDDNLKPIRHYYLK